MTADPEQPAEDPQQPLKDYFFNLILYRQSLAIPDFLKEHPDAPQWKFNNDLTPLITAVRQGHNEIVEVLLQAGACVGDRTDHGFTALIYAGRDNNPAAIDILLKHGADIKDSSNIGDTALLQAIEGRHSLAATMLAERGADLEARGGDGMTPLLEAARTGEAGICAALLRHGANIEAVNRQGQNALALARQWRDGNTDNQKWLDTIALLEPVFAAKDRRELEQRLDEIGASMQQGTEKPVTVQKPLRLKPRQRLFQFLYR